MAIGERLSVLPPYEIDQWFSNVTVTGADVDAEEAIVRFEGATRGHSRTLPREHHIFNMPLNMTSAYLFLLSVHEPHLRRPRREFGIRRTVGLWLHPANASA